MAFPEKTLSYIPQKMKSVKKRNGILVLCRIPYFYSYVASRTSIRFTNLVQSSPVPETIYLYYFFTATSNALLEIVLVESIRLTLGSHYYAPQQQSPSHEIFYRSCWFRCLFFFSFQIERSFMDHRRRRRRPLCRIVQAWCSSLWEKRFPPTDTAELVRIS